MRSYETREGCLARSSQHSALSNQPQQLWRFECGFGQVVGGAVIVVRSDQGVPFAFEWRFGMPS